MMENKPKSRGASNQQVGRAGEHFVVEELNKRGGKGPSKSDSTQHAIEEKRLQGWQGRWEILGIFD